MGDISSELEAFREQWHREVTARSGKDRAPPEVAIAEEAPSSAASKPATKRAFGLPLARTSTAGRGDDDEVEDVALKTYHDLGDKDSAFRLGSCGSPGGPSGVRRGSTTTDVAPVSALEHYEKAVEKESQGSLGESLNLYRKAYRMDASVDRTYRNKHFPSSSFPNPTNPNPSNTPSTVPNPAHHSLRGLQPSTAQLIADFANLSITPAPPSEEGSPPPACPVATLPTEILVEVLLYSAIMDVASFVRLAQVCKRFAYLVATEESIWKRVCCGAEFGFGTMHYDFTCSILGEPLPSDIEGCLLSNPSSSDLSTTNVPPPDTSTITISLLHATYASSWRLMFQTRPRIRFSGVYISTVNYARPGASSANQVSWNTPVHIVTYYRYLRFFRDGTVLSLLSVVEPADVVHHLTKDNVALHSGGAAGALPSAVVKHTFRGRWRLSGPASSTANELESEGDVHIETEGVGEKYFYQLHLSIRSSSANSSRKPKGNKLVWKGFRSYNRLTDDWAEFRLKNDTAFFWSRVRSYGV